MLFKNQFKNFTHSSTNFPKWICHIMWSFVIIYLEEKFNKELMIWPNSYKQSTNNGVTLALFRVVPWPILILF